jgi:cytochrome c551/c552
MKLATVSTLWDYINRAMPWTAPKSLSTEEVYAVTAYILNLGGIVPDDFTLSDKNIAEVQKLMPNRDGMTQAHGMWKTDGKPDVKNIACMKNCATEVKVHSELPEFAHGAHGNMAQQNRPFGAVRGVDTTPPAAAAAASAKPAAIAAPAGDDGLRLVKQHSCVACHGMTNKIVGPGFSEIAGKYKGNAAAEASLMVKVKNGGSGAWGAIPMPANAGIKDAEIRSMVQWILSGAKGEAK